MSAANMNPGSESFGFEDIALPPEIELSRKAQENDKNGQNEKGSELKFPKKPLLPKTLCGFLEKQGEKGLIKGFKRRWFVFQPRRCLLYYYRNPDDPSELGHIDISNATFAMDISSGGMDQFDICTTNRVYRLQAQDQQTALYWLQELQARRREHSRQITAMCHEHPHVEALPVSTESVGLITSVVPTNVEEDDALSELIPAPETVGESAAKRAHDGRSGISLKNMKTEFKNFASKRHSMYASSSIEEQPETLERSSSVSEYPASLSKKTSIAKRKFVRSSSTNVEKPVQTCPQCKKLTLQLEDCRAQLEEAKEYAQARAEALKSLNKYIREDVLEAKSNVGQSGTSTLKNREELEKQIQKLQEKLRTRGQDILDFQKEVAMLKEVIASKDEVVMKTTNELATAEESTRRTSSSADSYSPEAPPEKNVSFGSLGSSGGSQSFFNHIENLVSDKDKNEKLKEALKAYIAQNSFLNSEVIELNKLRKDDTERIRTYIVKNQTQEADLCRIKSKFYLLVQEVNAPLKDGKTDLPEEVISQLLEEAIEIESQSKMGGTENQTLFDRYGFYTRLEPGDEGALAVVADKLNRKSDEITKAASIDGNVRQTSINVKWENYMLTNRNREFQKSPELKNLVRSGVPHEFRSIIWLKCVNNFVKPIKRISGCGYYERLLKSKKDSPAAKQIGLDLLRTLPSNKHYDKQNSDGIERLRRVLLAYSWHNPDIGYCQGLNRLAAITLLYLSEEDAFWALVALVEYIMPKDYYSKTLIASQSDQRVLKDILSEKVPKVSEHLDKMNIDLSLVTFNWFLTAFVDSVPIEVVLRIWDTLWYEGTKVLFRYALAIFYMNESKILEITDHMTMFTFLRHMPSQINNDDQFYHAAFQALNPFPMQKVTSLRDNHMSALETELAELDKIRREYVETKSDEPAESLIDVGE